MSINLLNVSLSRNILLPLHKDLQEEGHLLYDLEVCFQALNLCNTKQSEFQKKMEIITLIVSSLGLLTHLFYKPVDYLKRMEISNC